MNLQLKQDYYSIITGHSHVPSSDMYVHVMCLFQHCSINLVMCQLFLTLIKLVYLHVPALHSIIRL